MTKLSRSKLDLFLECPRCFWLDVKKGIKRPPPAPYTLNTAIDYLLKQEFDLYREQGIPHPAMTKHGIRAVPFAHQKLNDWRHNFTGVQHLHAPTDFLVYGAVDDVWVDKDGALMVVDYKATGAREHQIYDSYKRQMEIYQWLLRHNGFHVSDTGYFVFARVKKGNGFSMPDSLDGGNISGEAALSFDLFVESYEGDDTWVEEMLKSARTIYDSEKAPEAADGCLYCEYREGAREMLC